MGNPARHDGVKSSPIYVWSMTILGHPACFCGVESRNGSRSQAHFPFHLPFQCLFLGWSVKCGVQYKLSQPKNYTQPIRYLKKKKKAQL